jgi:methenyltetrahydrofolate cyclohydrolase
VSVAAVSASLGLGLVEKVLRIAGLRRGFSGDRVRLDQLMDAARAGSDKLAGYADEDVAAYNDYLASKRRGDMPAMDAALRAAVESPMKIARAAVEGLDLCAEAAGIIPAALAADLGTAVVLLAGAARATLLSVDSNLGQLPPDSQFHRDALAERGELHHQAQHKAKKILEHIASNRIPNAP